MSQNLIADKIKLLSEEIKSHNKKYYIDNNPEISDEEFDKLNRTFYDLLKQNPDIKFNDLELLGSKPNKKEKKYNHLKPMLSLQNIFDLEEFIDFDKRIYRFLNIEYKNNQSKKGHENKSLLSKFEYCIEQKFDGLSFSATYIDGEFNIGLTRGDGFIGEDITHNLKTIENFPKKLNLKNPPKKIEIRGEIYLSIENFKKLNKIALINGEKEFVNPRNAASGSLRILDSEDFRSRGLEYFAYNIGYYENLDGKYLEKIQTQSDTLLFLKEIGFRIFENFYVSNDLMKIYEYYLNTLSLRKNLEYEIDGIVIKINDIKLQEKLGSTGKYPRHSGAFKFPSNNESTRIIDVIFSIGRTGSITPVAILEPISISGVTIRKASLHNFDEINRLDIMINDIVNVKRSGDVIPQIIMVLKEKRDEEVNTIYERKKIIEPEKCPSCASKLFKNDEEAILRCENIDCESKLIEYIKYFVSRDAFNIIGLGSKQINYFFNKGFIKSSIDIFFLEERFSNEIRSLENWGEKSSNNLFENIKKSKNISFSKMIFALGIRLNGEMNSKILAKFFQNKENFLDFIKSFEENQEKKNSYISSLKEIDGLGEKAIDEILKYFSFEKNRCFLFDLLKIINIIYEDDNKKLEFNEKNIFYNKNIVFTGSLNLLSRQAAKELCSKHLNANIQSSITSSTNFLIYGEKSGSKLEKAKLITNIQILDENKFISILKDLNIDKLI